MIADYIGHLCVVDAATKVLTLAPPRPAAPPATAAQPPRARRYHHGNLRQALIDAALQLAQARGPDGVSVREAARLIGVSPGAPFRHFPNRRALMTAVAEQAAERLGIEVRAALARARGGPLGRLRAQGRGYLRWAGAHPAHFRIISARDQLDLQPDGALLQHIAGVRALTLQALLDGQQAGQLPAQHRAADLALLARATVYGLARMQLDGHFGQWAVPAEQEAAAMARTLDLLVDLMAANGRAD